jgi:subtilase family serine protease
MLSMENFHYVRFRAAALRTLTSSVFGVLLAAVATVPGHAQQKVPPNFARITTAVDDFAVTTLKGNVHPLAQRQNDLGAVPLSQPMNHLQLVLQRSPAQEAALEAYLADVQIKSSPNYHKWLTPQQFGELYGPNDADIQTLTAWLTNHGFTVNKVSNGRTFIDFSGSAAQVQGAFNTSIHSYKANGLNFYANTSDPKIPSAFASVVVGVAHLNNIPLKPTLVRGKAAKYDSQAHHFVPVAGTSGVHPDYTVTIPNNGSYLFTVPADAATIYDTPNSFNANFSGGTSYTGTGVTIGIMGQSDIDATLVQNYRQLFVGDTKAPVISNLDGVGDVSGDDTESYLDNEVAGGLAPGATIHFYTASATTDNGVLTSAEYAIDVDNTIDILSLSYGACELYNTTSGNSQLNALWQQAAAQGITVLVSTGDSGSAGCDNPNTEQYATGLLAVNGLASTPYDIAVGGTDYDVLALGTFSDYVNDSSAGDPTTFYRTALGYIPEATWNDSTFPNLTVSQNVLLSYSQVQGTDNISAGSGGASNCSVNTTTNFVGTCTSGYPKPSWQTGSGVPNDQVRDVPDVALLAGDGLYGALWTICDGSANGNDSADNPGTANCVADSTGDFFTNGVGGTSAATPAFAGILALVVQKTGQRQGQAAPILYSLFASTPSVFHDVTTGNNAVGCTTSATTTANCVENAAGFDFETGFDTNAGYDLATGLGSVDATLLVNDWTSAASSLFVANVAATPSATTITTADPLTFTVNVTPLATAGATPTGSVVVTDGVYTSPSFALTNGAATITIPANTLVANAADTFTISYTPTGTTFAPASDFVVIAITQAVVPSITVSGQSISISAPGGAGTSTISVTPAGGFTGAVNLTCAVTGPAGATSLPTCSLAPTSVTIAGTTAATSVLSLATTATTTAGSYTATVTGADAATGKVTGSAPIAVTVLGATPSLAVSGQPVTITLPNQTTGLSTVTITPGGGFTGAVNLACSITSPSGAISPPICAFSPTSVTVASTAAVTSSLNVAASTTTSVGAYTMNVTATDAATGKITASDSIPLTITGTAATETISFTPAQATATVSSPGQSGTATLNVTGNYTGGKIAFTCMLATAPSGAATAYNPACSVAGLTTANGVAATTATFTTTAPTSSALSYPKTNQQGKHWYTAAGGAALACILFFGIPARRRGWRSMLGLLVFLVTMAGVGCGGGSSNNGGGGTTGTTTGTYTYTVVGTDSANSTVTTTTPATITLTVN